ncbi:hypothetical protein EVAR_36121_1 [Eumeta japonica]|uniref:Uncharacterized protein n=1 Tax=Eumeta variegata TaxID=151549 RepID=A0A4C1X515_EUMVA|nr:hypothetical protein EVAR_36121_1 [Eumeta japonica]
MLRREQLRTRSRRGIRSTSSFFSLVRLSRPCCARAALAMVSYTSARIAARANTNADSFWWPITPSLTFTDPTPLQQILFSLSRGWQRAGDSSGVVRPWAAVTIYSVMACMLVCPLTVL